jgi:hypothetical protein
MFARELADGTFLMIEQEDHTDVSAQFAAHWGNERFARPDPFRSVVFGTIYHDSGHREMEADLPIDVERGVPYAIGRTPPGLRKNEADVVNAQWVRGRDPYAALLVSMPHTGLRKDRYDTVRKRADDGAPYGKLGIDDAFNDLADWQRQVVKELELDEPDARANLWYNYRLLQVFDLLSLYFCRDGFKKGAIQSEVLEGVPVKPGSPETAEITITATSPTSLKMSPYPLDMPALAVSMMARVVTPVLDQPEPLAKEAYYQARRTPLTWEITG